ncbi:MAG: pyruvate, phosphate dikinase [Deltaproteobacteria bacterium]|nr:pyruvate, phosphate dikinase [Deltaproteobacteria bacterium]
MPLPQNGKPAALSKSKALEANLLASRLPVTLDPAFQPLLTIMGGREGLRESLEEFLTEVCHPYKNWAFILERGRQLAPGQFHLFRDHPLGPQGAALFLEVFLSPLGEPPDAAASALVRGQAVDVILLYLKEIIRQAGPRLAEFAGPLSLGLDGLAALPEADFLPVLLGSPSVEGLAGQWRDLDLPAGLRPSLDRLIARYLEQTYTHWLGQPDLAAWAREAFPDPAVAARLAPLWRPLAHGRLWALRRQAGELAARLAQDEDDQAAREALLALPGQAGLVEEFGRLPGQVAAAGAAEGQGGLWELLLLFHLLALPGLAVLHERFLVRVNRALAGVLASRPPVEVEDLLERAFATLAAQRASHPLTVLDSIVRMGAAVYAAGPGRLVDQFQNLVIRLGFETPQLAGVGADWQTRSNALHLANLRAWLALVELSPRRSKRLLSALIVNLALSGVFLRDTDLFPRDLTRFLNSGMQPVYYLAKQLCRLFPVYFNEIGAEGRLRDISTEVDELTGRRDRLIHFLRKQSHVESSPRTVELMEGVFEYWRTRDKSHLAELVPADVFAQIPASGPLVDGLHWLMTELYHAGLLTRIPDLLTVPPERLAGLLAEVRGGVSELDRQRLLLARELYQLLHAKYHTAWSGVESWLAESDPAHLPDRMPLKYALTREDPRRRLAGILDYLEELQEVILSEDSFPAREDIFHKRHIAADIPSMYGTYHEAKFDALSLSFRLENLANSLLGQIREGLDLRLITRTTLVEIHDLLRLLGRCLRLDGLNTHELSRQTDLLTQSLSVRGFSFTQYLDIFRGMEQAVKNLVHDHFDNPHHQQMAEALATLNLAQLSPRYRPPKGSLSPQELGSRVSEIFLRERIATSLGLQHLDLLITRIVGTISQQGHELPPERLRRLLNYDPDRAVTPLSPVHAEIEDPIYLGAKGLGLVRLTALGLPVPPGFVVSTEVFRAREVIADYPPANRHFRQLLESHLQALERKSGRIFGDPENPLVVSVRSGSSISQPGMLNTFLDVGLNRSIVEGLAGRPDTGPWFAWDSYRRLLQNLGMSAGLARDGFDAIMTSFKQKYGLPLKGDFQGEQMREVALAYARHLAERGVRVEEDPYEQLYQAVMGVFESWFSPRAASYRKIMAISDDWGTSATVQRMVFGNLSAAAGSGVLFTHNPDWSGDKLILWGDYTAGNQGEDVVGGLVATRALTRRQAEAENREPEQSLEAAFPAVYGRLRELARTLIYGHGYNPQEVEFTFEGSHPGDLWILQTRDMVLRERRSGLGFDPGQVSPELVVGHGIGVSGGALAGRIVFTLADIRHWREAEPDTPLILVRGDTVPEDIEEIFQADGLLTARGGATSHAAIVAHRLNKTCVVGVSQMICNETQETCTLGSLVLGPGEWISLDGLDGKVYRGKLGGGQASGGKEAI